MKEIWMVAREMGGWAEAGGVKDVVADQTEAWAEIGWQVTTVLPLYGFLADRVRAAGSVVWTGPSAHPQGFGAVRAWKVPQGRATLLFLESPSLVGKGSPYTYTEEDEARDPSLVRGEGFSDGFRVNLEFQWALASYWAAQAIVPPIVLGHDGHAGFLAAICRTHPAFGTRFHSTRFALLIHNAGPLYRQEMPVTATHEALTGLPASEVRACVLDHHIDPMVCAGLHGRLGTVSENYASELLTGTNDHWSGGFGRWLRSRKVALRGITNGLKTDDKDPRFPEKAGLPFAFDPLLGTWEGKALCRQALRERLLLRPAAVYGRLRFWNQTLYVMQGRLTTQKGVEALAELVGRALREEPRASFLVMAQGERRYEERFIRLARDEADLGRFLFVNRFEEGLAKLVFASGDFFLMPSEYEPCGLTDLKAQLCGTLPIVHLVGGLVKVRHGETGFGYRKGRAGGLWKVFTDTLDLALEDPGRLAALRRQAFISVLEDYQWPRILDERYVAWLTEGSPGPILSGPAPT